MMDTHLATSREHQMSMLELSHLGISMRVVVMQEIIDALSEEMGTWEEHEWPGNKGKFHFLDSLRKKLVKLDKYFDSHLNKAVSSNKRWKGFCNNCVTYAVAHAVINEAKIILLHPSCWDEREFLCPDGTPVPRPALIAGYASL